MIRKLVVPMLGAVVLLACSAEDAPPGPAGPALSLSRASGISVRLQRTITEVGAGSRILSVVDTTVWAPFDGDGAALPSSTGAGVPGAVGRRSPWTLPEPGASRYASFVDSAGVLHELTVVVDGDGVGTQVAYRRQGRLAAEQRVRWAGVSGGWTMESEALTMHPAGAPAVRVDVIARGIQVARAAPVDGVFRAGAGLAGLFAPQPLAAQFHFRECTKEWLGWGGAALLAELAWAKFLKTKGYKDFKLAVAATGAAGVALDKLVDCMVEQDEQQPDPGP
jgi:hypothetical protein